MLKRFLKMARPDRKYLILGIAGLIGATAAAQVTPELVRRLTAALEDGRLTHDLLWVFAAVLLAAYLARALCRFAAMYFTHVAAWNFVGNLTAAVYAKLQKLSMRFYSRKQTGELMSRLINDTRMMEVLIAHALPDLFGNLLMLAFVTVMIFLIHPLLAALTMIPIPFVVLASRIFIKKVMPFFYINQEVLGELSGSMQDRLSGMREIQAFSRESAENKRVAKECLHYAFVNKRANLANALFHPAVEALTGFGTLAVIAVGGTLALGGAIPAADLVGFFMYLTLLYTPLIMLARQVEEVQASMAGGRRVIELLDESEEIVDMPGAIELERAAGRLTFDHVGFRYLEEEPVLTDIHFTAEPGEMVALVGATGVGKTTIVSLAERFYDPTEGAVLLDGIDLRKLTVGSVRANLSLVLQDVFLFNGTIAENIACGVESAAQENAAGLRQRIEKAAEIACADGFIMEMPDGYDTVIGERGIRLSGGQKQRVAIARAVLRDAPVLILDEATSAVDTKTEESIAQAVENLVAGRRTMIVIAHRLSTVRRADRILVLEQGRVAEQGTHEQLLAAGGIYAGLYKRSAK